jgi:NAD-dependent dihydropyrimidine dehydrogenase PreA subunit
MATIHSAKPGRPPVAAGRRVAHLQGYDLALEYGTRMTEPSSCKRPGLVVPVIDRTRCEGKEDCVRVCPYGVFEMGTLDLETRRALPPMARVKAFFHRYRQASVVHPDACQACGLCVQACPERAIRLRAVGGAASAGG